jgi:methyl-accepting chemotaxis protein
MSSLPHLFHLFTDADELKLLDSQMGAQSGQIGELQKKMEVVMKSEAGKKFFAEVVVKRAAYREARDGIFKLKEAGQDLSGESFKQMT